MNLRGEGTEGGIPFLILEQPKVLIGSLVGIIEAKSEAQNKPGQRHLSGEEMKTLKIFHSPTTKMLLIQTRYWPEVEIQVELKIGRAEEI